MKFSQLVKVIATFAFALALGGCVLPVSPPSPDFNAFMSDPPNGAVVQLGTAINLAAQAYSYVDGRGVTSLIFYANGGPLGESATLFPFGANTWEGELSWTPPAVGEYFVQVQAVHRGGSYVSDPVRVCVVDHFTLDPGSYDYVYGYEGPCPFPDRDSSAVAGPISMSVVASPDSLTYDPSNPPDYTEFLCPGLPTPSISFVATVIDPHEDVAYVAVYLQMAAGPGGVAPAGSEEDRAILLTPSGSSVLGGTRIFRGGEPYIVGGLRTNFGDQPGEVLWAAGAYGRDETNLALAGGVIPANPCIPTPLNAPFPPITPTPASARDCPSGTFFAETTHQCLPVQILPTKKGGPNCAQYTTDTSCNAAPGCAYDYVAKKCKGQ